MVPFYEMSRKCRSVEKRGRLVVTQRGVGLSICKWDGKDILKLVCGDDCIALKIQKIIDVYA